VAARGTIAASQLLCHSDTPHLIPAVNKYTHHTACLQGTLTLTVKYTHADSLFFVIDIQQLTSPIKITFFNKIWSLLAIY